ncbi:hypothetical protein IWX90DRAFT_422332 [Phyllosticta citrichinensis]|uniref:Uncharacterized protein n=1 Tax=Phyllosticta citrichinensis TaxID=1130410 RepID=A0ABR1Y8A0_9PEZI
MLSGSTLVSVLTSISLHAALSFCKKKNRPLRYSSIRPPDATSARIHPGCHQNLNRRRHLHSRLSIVLTRSFPLPPESPASPPLRPSSSRVRQPVATRRSMLPLSPHRPTHLLPLLTIPFWPMCRLRVATTPQTDFRTCPFHMPQSLRRLEL